MEKQKKSSTEQKKGYESLENVEHCRDIVEDFRGDVKKNIRPLLKYVDAWEISVISLNFVCNIIQQTHIVSWHGKDVDSFDKAIDEAAEYNNVYLINIQIGDLDETGMRFYRYHNYFYMPEKYLKRPK